MFAITGRNSLRICSVLLTPLLLLSSCGAGRVTSGRGAARVSFTEAAAVEFETWVLVQNPGDAAVHVGLEFETENGPVAPPELQGVEIAPRSRRTFRVNDYVSTYHVSTLVHATDGEVVAERAVYGGDRTWGTDSVGTSSTAPTWYLAEGSTEGGMETWVLVQNPGDAAVHVGLEFETENGPVAPPELQGVEIAPRSRRTFRVNDYVSTYHVSTLVHATDGEVVAERAVYGGDRTWGTDSVGTSSTAPTWYLAEGSTEGGMETWVLVQNPGDAAVHVGLEFETENGPVAPPELQGVEIAPRSRRTFRVNDYVSTYHVSTLVHATDGEVVAERAVYGGDRTWGTDSVGTSSTAPTWYLAEGSTEGGMETWVLVQNPGDAAVHVGLEFETENGPVAPPELQGVEIAPRSRRTFRVNDYVSTYHVSTLVHATDGEVVAERAVYGGDRTWGTDSVGTSSTAPTWYLAEGAAWPGAGQGMVALTLTERSGVSREGELVTCGVPLPREAGVYNVSGLAVVSAAGVPVPLQAEVTSRWGGTPGDTSRPARWALLTFPASVGAGGSAVYYLRTGGGGPDHPSPVTLSDDGTILTVDTGAARFEMRRDTFDLLHSVEINGAGTVLSPRPGNGFSLLSSGREFRSALSAPSSFEILERGPLRSMVKVEGAHAATSSSDEFMNYTAYLYFYAGESYVRVLYTLENRNAPVLDESAQPLCKDIGSPNSATFQGLQMRLGPETGGAPGVAVAAGEGEQYFSSTGPELSLYQDSSGTGYWDCHRGNHPRPQSWVSFRGWQARRGGTLVGAGDQAQPWLAAWGNGVGLAVGMKDFWQNNPKGLAWEDGEARLSLFPEEYAGDYSFRAGEEKTHELFLYFFAGDPDSAGVGERMAAMQDPLFGLAPAAWYAGSGALGRLALEDEGSGSDAAAYEDQNRAAFDPSVGETGNSLAMSIEANDFYGWCDYGDVPLDYETPSGQMNLKYDFDRGMILQFLRTGDSRWWDLAGAACRHLADEDVLHYQGEIDHWADGGYFGHSYHDEPGNDNPHRNYGAPHPDLEFGVAGGLDYYFLTGYPPSRDAAYEISDNVRYRFENSYGRGNGEGYAEGYNDYGSDSFRPLANGLSIMSEAYAACGDPRYLETAEWIVEVSHNAADPFLAAPSAGAEGGTSIFSVDMFTASLGCYLDVLEAHGQPDRQGAGGYLVELVRHEVDCCWRAAGGFEGFPYAWGYDGTDDTSFGVVDLSNWHLLSADCLTYAWLHGGGDDLLELAGRAFHTGAQAPNGEGTYPAYWSTKESANAASLGQVYLSAR